MLKTCSPLLNNVLTLPCEKKHHISYFYNALSVLAIGQLRHQSATAPSLATHAADGVAAHRCHESDNDVIFTSLVK